ncbi:MAG: hypothetical protein LBE91_06785 [Tannerella sp.]|jgi:hypothetical protein|nr:hypothetical protein [Tannerella sp.]
MDFQFKKNGKRCVVEQANVPVYLCDKALQILRGNYFVFNYYGFIIFLIISVLSAISFFF